MPEDALGIPPTAPSACQPHPNIPTAKQIAADLKRSGVEVCFVSDSSFNNLSSPGAIPAFQDCSAATRWCRFDMARRNSQTSREIKTEIDSRKEREVIEVSNSGAGQEVRFNGQRSGSSSQVQSQTITDSPSSTPTDESETDFDSDVSAKTEKATAGDIIFIPPQQTSGEKIPVLVANHPSQIKIWPENSAAVVPARDSYHASLRLEHSGRRSPDPVWVVEIVSPCVSLGSPGSVEKACRDAIWQVVLQLQLGH
ncbi:hypothetical protein N7492_004577 [Penicillium capsulatum]|uniref:Uncharacterized protein n=1 Tax=Penicillium capsulatum TaxID=69766 RepID=A0A9W9LQ61_9EURO|nr:hypothetical protein N7492_004577 [Penicillium capsulatum]KAJ6136306.1 hypothetical protein N7512_001466 [Penicillium capsulatum]